jgi:hypothetical protein
VADADLSHVRAAAEPSGGAARGSRQRSTMPHLRQERPHRERQSAVHLPLPHRTTRLRQYQSATAAGQQLSATLYSVSEL